MRFRFVIVVMVIFFIAGRAENYTNVELLHQILTRPVQQAVDSVSSGLLKIKIQTRKTDDLSPWIVQQLRQDFLQKNFQVLAGDDTDQADLTIVIEEVLSSITYKGMDHDLWLRIKTYERTIETLLSFYIKNKQESILYSYNKSKKHTDILKASQLKQVENKLYPFSMGNKISANRMSKIIEPAIVSITTAAIVYLFFSLRSGSK